MAARITALLSTILVVVAALSGCSQDASDDDECTGSCPTESSTSSDGLSASVSVSVSATSTSSNTSTSTAPTPRAPMTFARNITDNAFPDGTFTVQKGDKVVWTHRGSAPHTVTTDPGAAESFDSGTMFAMQTYEHTFAVVGQVPYHCNVHGFMTGSIAVVETAS